ncbi:lantibiotic dehydratase [Streptomyces sp. HMX112]|uniref:lantibiotic dehydratase n=1 Tax=Streptomyces sp. HMX112 TaxID=3390850 RepID=UPI003A8084A1
MIELSGLAVICDGQVLHLVSCSRRQIIEPGTPHPLQIECQTPALVRFLDELVRGQAVRVTGPVGTLRPMHWGAAHHLPVLPRVVTGRSVLSPAMWRLSFLGPARPSGLDSAVGGRPGDPPRATPDPGRVLAEHFNQRPSLALPRPGDLALLREEAADQQFDPSTSSRLPRAMPSAGRPAEVSRFRPRTLRPRRCGRRSPAIGRPPAPLGLPRHHHRPPRPSAPEPLPAPAVPAVPTSPCSPPDCPPQRPPGTEPPRCRPASHPARTCSLKRTPAPGAGREPRSRHDREMEGLLHMSPRSAPSPAVRSRTGAGTGLPTQPSAGRSQTLPDATSPPSATAAAGSHCRCRPADDFDRLPRCPRRASGHRRPHEAVWSAVEHREETPAFCCDGAGRPSWVP